jgi:hypothetical protein
MSEPRKTKTQLSRRNSTYARALWPEHCSTHMIKSLRELTTSFGFSIGLGDLSVINGHWYVTHSGLLRLASRRACNSIRVEPVPEFSDPNTKRWVFKSTVYKSRQSRGFVGFGDADPSNVSPLVSGAEMRIAETRAVNRALRKAYGIGLCSVEELGTSFHSHEPPQKPRNHASASNGDSSKNGQPRLRDKLCMLIRRYELDPELVKRYAASFCGTETVSDASRDLVASFIQALTEQAETNPGALTCKLNSFRSVEEVHS